ncbi:MAG: Fic/DOC family N-terminal domain-containing protein [bacterium]
MKPYEPDSLPLDSIDWAAHVLLIGQANAALARYDGMLQSIVNPSVLLSPLTTQEAVLSSRIEGTQASMEEVLEYEADPSEKIESSKHADIQEIINYRRAMGMAVERLKKRPLCLNLIKELHAALLDSVRGRNKAPGEFRRIQNFIGPPGCSIENASFVPPSPELLGPAMNNLEKYLHYDEKDPLVQLAVAKAQFEIIHPFLDGNGRMGRMLIPLFLYTKGLLSSPMFYLSAYLEEHREIYYQRLQSVSQNGDWNGWISFFLGAIVKQAEVNTKKTRDILALYERMKEKVPTIVRSRYSIQAIDALFSWPIFPVSGFVTRSKIPKDSARRIIAALRANAIIEDVRPGRGRRAAILLFRELISIARAGD